jgi:hypothetical protein
MPLETLRRNSMLTYDKEKDELSKVEAPDENNIALADIVEDEKDKKILEPVIKPKTEKKRSPYKMGIVIVHTAYLMKEPDEYSDIISVLKKGDAVIIEDDTDEQYYKVTANIKVGYILKNQIEMK